VAKLVLFPKLQGFDPIKFNKFQQFNYFLSAPALLRPVACMAASRKKRA
jgi:hypothetical protein